jgi:hypothetical protein
MAVVKVTKIGRAKSGKYIAYFDNRHGQTDCYLVSDKIAVPPEGVTIEADTNSWDFRGTTFWGLNSWKEVKGQAAPQQSPASSGNANQNAAQQPLPQNGSSGNGALNRLTDGIAKNPSLPFINVPAKLAGWDIQSGDLSRYASNIVASAITAGLIKEPAQVVSWAAAAYTSGNSLREGLFVRSIPAGIGAPDPNENQGQDMDDPDFDDKIPF